MVASKEKNTYIQKIQYTITETEKKRNKE